MVRPSSFRHLGLPQLMRLLPSPRIQRRQRFLLSDLSLRRAWWESTSTTDVPGEFAKSRNFDGRVFESVRVHQVTALICRQSHTSIDFANSFTLPFPTPGEFAPANSLHYATAYLPSMRTLWTMTMSGIPNQEKSIFGFFEG